MSVVWGKKALKVIEHLDLLIRSRYPLIYIVSPEEERVKRAISEIVQRQKKNFYIWSLADGIIDASGMQITKCESPREALVHIRKNERRAIWLLVDLYHFIDDPVIVRLLKEIAVESKRIIRTLILIAPTINLPQDLDKDVEVMEFPLPSYEELESVLDSLIARYAADPRITINLSPKAKDQIIRSSLGLTLKEAEGIYCQALITERSLDDSDVELVLQAKKALVQRSGLLEYVDASETIEDVGGLWELKRWLHKRRNAFSEEARQFGLPYPKGLVMLGVQGCGKSLCAKAISRLWRLPLLRLDLSRIFGKYIGSSEQNIRRGLQMAETMAPCVLWVDEVEKVFSGVKSSGMSDAGTTARVFGYFLTWLQEKESAVFVVCTANDISQVPPEFMRRGRFDEIFFVDLPSPEERREIFIIHLKKRHRNPDKFDLDALVSASEGFTGAEIEQAVISALYDAFDDNMRALTTADLLKALKETVPLSVTMREEVEGLRRWARGRARPASGKEPETAPPQIGPF